MDKEKAIWVFENIVYKKRSDRLPKLQRFKKQLGKAKISGERGKKFK